MNGGSGTEVWAAGEAYEQYVGRWSRPVAEGFLDWLEVAPGRQWLDVGCGTGALSGTILRRAQPAGVTGLDPSEAFLARAREQLQDQRAAFDHGDAQALPYHDRRFDVAVSGLVLSFVPDQAKMVGEMRRVVRPGGAIALYVWDYAGRMELMRHFWDAAAALDPAAGSLDQGMRFPVCRPRPLAELLRRQATAARSRRNSGQGCASACGRPCPQIRMAGSL